MMTRGRPLLQETDDDQQQNESNKKRQFPTKKQIEKRRQQQLAKRHKKQEDDAEERLLENVVFGDHGSILNKIDDGVDLVTIDATGEKGNLDDNVESGGDVGENQLFVVDRFGRGSSPPPHDDIDDIVQERLVNDALDDISDDELRDLLRSKSTSNDNKTANTDSAPSSLRKPAWYEEDQQVDAESGFSGCRVMPKLIKSDDKYQDYLEKKFTDIYEPPSWATKALENIDNKKRKAKEGSDEDDESDDDDDFPIEGTSSNYVRKNKILDKDFLRIKKCSHLNKTSRVRTSANCVNFHPNATVALLGSKIGLVRLFQVDGKINSMIQSIYFRGYRLCDAKFVSINGREEIIVGSDGSDRNSVGFCYYYDMIAGKIVRVRLEKGTKLRYSLRAFEISPNGRYLAGCDENGRINILSTSSKEHVAELKMNGEVSCLAFSSDSNYLVSHGRDNGSQAYVWDIRNLGSRCVNRFSDLGTVEATSIALSQNGTLAAIGSNMGVVNLYRFDDIVRKANPEPIRSIMNLTTAVTSLKFNHDGQLLMMASSEKDDSIRFFNTNSLGVFKNFPLFVGGGNSKTYGRIFDVDISPNGGYASFATGNGTGHLFRINEYSNY